MRLIVFDLVGYIAHFRRIYTTTTSLSYSFPPRTALMGTIAAILGMEKDSYYDIMTTERAGIAVSVLKPIRRISVELNYLFPKKGDEWKSMLAKLMGMGKKTQVTAELVIAEDFEPLRYRVFFSHENGEILDRLSSMLREGRSSYPISLGTANNLAHAEFVGDVKAERVRSKGETVDMRTVIPLRAGEVEPIPGVRVMREERVPADFGSSRRPKRVEDYIFEERGAPLRVKLRPGEEYFEISLGEDIWRGVFL